MSTQDSPPLSPSLTRAAAVLRCGQMHEAHGEFAAALACYDNAITAGRAGSLEDTETRRALGVAWMNRGNALQKLAAPESLALAIVAYDEAIALFSTLPTADAPAHLNHLGAAWLNRGHAQLLAHDANAAESFSRAIAVLSQLPLNDSPAYRLNLAGAWTNLAHASLTTAPDRSGAAARNALKLVAPRAASDLAFAMMSLRARRALVMYLGACLVGHAAPHALANEASDVIDDGLALARSWGARGATQLRPLAARLFRLGAQLYRIHQPHFLGEFLLEHLASGGVAADPEFRAIAHEALADAVAAAQRPQLLVAGDPHAEKLLATARSLRAAQQRVVRLPLVSSLAPSS